MSLTQQRLAEMDEDMLRTQVLVPLFEVMGFKGVHIHHGGTLELGKDILMWKPREFCERENYVVVVKAQPIKGNVVGKDSYSDVVRQIHQSFGSAYLDQTTLQDIRADRCIVVTSREFKKEAQNAIKGELRNTHLDKVTQFIDGDELWRLVDRHLGKKAVWAKLDQVTKTLEDASPHYRIVVNTSGNKKALSIEPKHPNAAKEQPVSFVAKFRFSPDEEGVKAKTALDQHFKSGNPASISGKFIKDFQLPELLRPYFDADTKVSEIRLGTSRLDQKFLVSVQITGPDGSSATLANIELANDRAGKEELSFSNDHQTVPWHFIVVMRRQKDQGIIAEVGTFGYRADYTECNVKQELEGLRFEKLFAQGGTLNIFNQETGILIGSAPVPKEREEPPQAWIRLIEMLAFIQAKTQIVIKAPASRIISGQEAALIDQTARILEDGQYFFGVEELQFDLAWEAAQKFIEISTSGSLLMDGPDQSATIFGNKIELGPVQIAYHNFSIEPAALEAIRKGISEKLASIPMVLTFKERVPCRAIYSKWNSKLAEGLS